MATLLLGAGCSASSAESGGITIMAAGDIGGAADGADATGDLIRAASPDAVLTLGDNAYPEGAASDYDHAYDPVWGSFRERTRPVPGNHDYLTDGAAGYVEYFGRDAVTNSVDGGLYYAWDVGDGWRAYAVNTEIDTTGAQLTWLRHDVAAHRGERYILYTHHPRYTSGAEHGPSTAVCPLWDALAAAGHLEIVLGGHNHQYERFAPMDCAGHRSADGARSFVVGSGGKTLYAFGPAQPGSEFRNGTDYGVLELSLRPDSYDWEFLASGRGLQSSRADIGRAGEVLDKGSHDL